MSMSYWPIVGYGVNLDELYEYLNKDKVNALIRDMIPNEEFEEDVLEDDTFYGGVYTSFAEFLCELDDSKVFSYENDGATTEYFLYQPRYWWKKKSNDPKTAAECDDMIAGVLKKVYDISDEELKTHIDYIDTVGMG